MHSLGIFQLILPILFLLSWVLNILQKCIICKLLGPSLRPYGPTSYVLTSDNCLGTQLVTFFLVVTQEEELC